MQEITLNIDGNSVKGKDGDTVLAVCRAEGIDIPTLCHLEGIDDIGACRLCVVEIEGERRPTPSCTYPVRNGLVVKTHTPQLEKYRRQILELMFAERNHFCMFCVQSGDCELQEMAYRYQMDNIRFKGFFPVLPVETLSKYLAIDHNRCILCGRCVRVCRQVAAIRAIDFGGRGAQTMITADINQPLGESSCTLCGACLQACPTGAIMNKTSLYKSKTKDCEPVATVCPGCSIGCEINVMVKDNNLVRIESPDIVAPTGSLCRIGRFELLSESRSRITSPMIRNENGNLIDCSLDDALEAIARKFSEQGNNYDGLISSRCPNETISQFHKMVTGVQKSNIVDTLDGREYRRISSGICQYTNGGEIPEFNPEIENILKADCILVIGSDIDHTHPVAGNLIRRAVAQNHAELIVVDSNKDMLPLWTDLWLKPEAGLERVLITGLAGMVMRKSLPATIKPELMRLLNLYEPGRVAEKTFVTELQLQKATDMLNRAKNAFIICGSNPPVADDDDLVANLLNLTFFTQKDKNARLNLIFLKQNLNSRGAWDMGMAKRDIRQHRHSSIYLLISDDNINDDWLEWLKSIDYLVVQASFHSPVIDIADVVLPSRIWAERGGTYVTADGRKVQANQVLEPRYGILPDEEIIQRLEQKMNITPARR